MRDQISLAAFVGAWTITFFFSYSTFLGLVAALANGIKACPATPTPNTLSTMLYKMAVTKTLEVYSGLDVSIPEK